MPSLGYDDDAARIGVRSLVRSRRFKLALLAMFLAGIALGVGLARLLR
jgi:hypothetical protein